MKRLRLGLAAAATAACAAQEPGVWEPPEEPPAAARTGAGTPLPAEPAPPTVPVAPADPAVRRRLVDAVNMSYRLAADSRPLRRRCWASSRRRRWPRRTRCVFLAGRTPAFTMACEATTCANGEPEEVLRTRQTAERRLGNSKRNSVSTMPSAKGLSKVPADCRGWAGTVVRPARLPSRPPPRGAERRAR
jgi:hypothetical protein